MGLRLMSDSKTMAPNPDPAKFTILKIVQFGEYCLVEANYPGCTTFGGNKLMIYKIDAVEIMKQTTLDPHFLHSGISPVARFPATDEGNKLALALLHALEEEK